MLCLGLLGPVCLVACRSKPTAEGGPAAGSASVRAAPVSAPVNPGWACRELGDAPLLSVGKSAKRAPSEEEEEDGESGVDMPFAVELGGARGAAGVFAVAGIQSERGESQAFVAWLDGGARRAQTVPLGRVFGDVEPPALLPFRSGWLALVSDNDARAGTLRLVGLSSPAATSIRRGAEIQGVRRDAMGFAFELSGTEGLVAHTALEKSRGVISLLRFDPEHLALKGKPQLAPLPADGDAELPRLVARPGGFYLAWIVRGAAAPATQLTARDAGVEPRLLEEGPTAIEVVPLDAAGVAQGMPKRITKPGARVLTFELVATPDGGALVLYRDERDGPGLERENAEAVLLRADGSSEEQSWELGDSAGLPALLTDDQPAGDAPAAWVAVPGEAFPRMFPLGTGLALGALKEEPRFATFEPLAISGGRWLNTRVRRGAREFVVLACTGKL